MTEPWQRPGSNLRDYLCARELYKAIAFASDTVPYDALADLTVVLLTTQEDPHPPDEKMITAEEATMCIQLVRCSTRLAKAVARSKELRNFLRDIQPQKPLEPYLCNIMRDLLLECANKAPDDFFDEEVHSFMDTVFPTLVGQFVLRELYTTLVKYYDRYYVFSDAAEQTLADTLLGKKSDIHAYLGIMQSLAVRVRLPAIVWVRVRDLFNAAYSADPETNRRSQWVQFWCLEVLRSATSKERRPPPENKDTALKLAEELLKGNRYEFGRVIHARLVEIAGIPPPQPEIFFKPFERSDERFFAFPRRDPEPSEFSHMRRAVRGLHDKYDEGHWEHQLLPFDELTEEIKKAARKARGEPEPELFRGKRIRIWKIGKKKEKLPPGLMYVGNTIVAIDSLYTEE